MSYWRERGWVEQKCGHIRWMEWKLYLGSGKCSIADSQDAIRPLMGDGIKLAIQLAHGDRLWVDNSDLNPVLLHEILHSKQVKFYWYYNTIHFCSIAFNCVILACVWMCFSAVIYSSTITKGVVCSLETQEITFPFHENFLSTLLCKKSSLYCGIVIQIHIHLELLEKCGSIWDFGSSHPLGTRKKYSKTVSRIKEKKFKTLSYVTDVQCWMQKALLPLWLFEQY